MQPMELAVAGDGYVYYIELAGRVKRLDPRTEKIETLGELKVTIENENGLIGLALDPKFAENHWIYLQYSPPDFAGQHISRFTLTGDKLDLASEKLLFKFEEQRKECCHHAGSMTFGPDGCLYIGTGDNTHPVGNSDGYAPLDERPGRQDFDSQRSAANSRSGSGKILRIRPTPEGGYEIPDGNLFPRDGSQGLPEIYAMGCRNPWRISVDAKTGYVYWGDVGPDADGDGPRGPRGYDEINQARAAGNFGWPYFIANNRAYHDVDYATGKIGAAFDSEAPINDSPNNTGTRKLPRAQPAFIYYPFATSARFPELGSGGRTACAGPVYYYDAGLASESKFPPHFDRVLFIYDWTRNWIKAVHLDAAGHIQKIEPFLPNQPFIRPIDMAFGPDGSLYVLEYGTTWGVNQDSRLVRIEYASGNRRPVAQASVTNNVGREPLEVSFSSAGSFDKDPGDKLSYEWRARRTDKPEAAPESFSREPNPTFTFRQPGIFQVELTVTDSQGATGTAAVPVMVGNTRPAIRLLYPADGDFFDADHPIPYKIAVRDEEDGTSDEDEYEAGDLDFLDPDAPSRTTLSVTKLASEPTGAEEHGPPGLRLMKTSDCFNCHAIDQKRVGPPLLEVANKYRNQPHALPETVKRVRDGSSGVWGQVPMLPHRQHTDEELQLMVSWIYALKAEDAVRVYQGFTGEIPAIGKEPSSANAPTAVAALALEAAYVDRGAEGIPPLTGSAKVLLHNRQMEAETAGEIHGPHVVTSASASGQKFLGMIDHGHYVRIGRVSLAKVSAVTARVSSAGAGGQIEVRQDRPDGPTLATLPVKVNGQWEAWYDVSAPLKGDAGTHDLFVVFSNPTDRAALMNLDSLSFQE